jgi:HSP20 family protein
MNITRWEPFKEMEDMLRQYSPLYSRALRPGNGGLGEWTPVADISESPAEYLIKADLPAVKKEDIKVTVDKGVITISGERKQEKQSKDENEIRVESFHGTFTRSFSLPDDIDANAIKAESKDGVLHVHIPRMQAPRPKSVAIEVK